MVLNELEDILESIQLDSQRLKAVKIINRYLKRWSVQRLSETDQQKEIDTHFQARNVSGLSKFHISQYPAIRRQATEYASQITVRVSHPEAACLEQ